MKKKIFRRYLTKTGNLMTLFTTFEETEARKRIHLNTIRNWAQFLPLIQPVLFTNSTTGFYVFFYYYWRGAYKGSDYSLQLKKNVLSTGL